LKAELTGIRVMLDMLRSEIAGEYELPPTTIGYVSAGLLLTAAISGVGFATQPLSALLLDAPVVACIIAALRGEIEEYVDWRIA
jgi:tetrahydromethanopterin S-methyltransferase subunit C